MNYYACARAHTHTHTSIQGEAGGHRGGEGTVFSGRNCQKFRQNCPVLKYALESKSVLPARASCIHLSKQTVSLWEEKGPE